ncbi:uncharacterized protein LOC129944962 [Eupeodes corollae]|uniref:uncharacterized protein LOC129944962 n=1 Tax=Eupeodes corollae TaxID=290404 RepID=UPI0024935FAA|nr:uncharacterized protein LOC129944962 [Eupeodes corollae]
MDFASRASYRGQVTKLVKSANEYLQSDDSKIKETSNIDEIEEELSVLLERLTATNESLKKANGDVVPLIKSDDMGKEADTVAEYEDKAISTIARLRCRLSKLRHCQGQPTINDINDTTQTTAPLPPLPPIPPSNFNAIKLKKLQPKKFSGEFKDWVPFWEQYRVLVHANPSLSTIDKFNYLETVLTGKAAETLAGLTPSEANYVTAITLLKEEYGNNEKIIDFTMQRLLSIQPVNSKTDAVGLRRYPVV